MRRPFPYLVFAVLVGVLSWNCSTGSSGNGGGLRPPTLTVTPQNPSVALGTPQTFTVTDSGGNSVSWALFQQASGNTLIPCSTCGILSASSASSGTAAGVKFTYTAPTLMPQPGAGVTNPAVVILQASDATLSPTLTATASITLTTNIAVSVAPKTANVSASNPTGIAFTPTVSNDTKMGGVNWSLSSTGLACTGTGATPCGSLSAASSASGAPITYTAPASAASTITVTLTATSVNATASDTATITVTPPISVSVTPPVASSSAGSTVGFPFTANVQNDGNNGGVTWTLTTPGAACTATICGTLSAASSASGTAVTYNAPASAAATFMVTITATSVSDGSKFGSATFTINTPQFLRYVFEVSTSIDTAPAISTYAVWPSTGQLRPLNYFIPSGLGGGGTTGAPPSAAIHPNGVVLYVIAPTIANAQLWTLNLGPNGVLQQTASSPMTVNSPYQNLTVDPLGQFLYATDSFGGTVGVFGLDQNGNPGTPATAATISNPTQLLIDPTGNYLFATSGIGASSQVAMYAINRSSAAGVLGALTAVGSPATGGTDDSSMALTQNGPSLYVLSNSSIYLFNISGAGLSAVTGSPFKNLLGTSQLSGQLTVDPTGDFLYVTGQSPDALYGFSIGASGTLTALTPASYPTGSLPNQVNVDPSGNFVYVANREDTWVYGRNLSVGQLFVFPFSPIRTRGFGVTNQLLSAGSKALTFTPTSLYVTNTASNTVSQFMIDPATGKLTSLGAPIATGSKPMGMAVLPDGQFAYTADSANPTGVEDISEYSISGGVLSPLGSGIPTGNTPTWMTPDLSGSFLYVVNDLGSNISTYTISSGRLTPESQVASTGTNPVFVTTEPTGQYLYTANSGAGTISEYSIQLPQGSLNVINPGLSAQGSNTSSIAVDPSGRYAYVGNLNTPTAGGTVGEFTITEGFGNLVSNSTQPFLPVGNGVSSLIVEPTGQYLFVTDFVSNKIYSYTIVSSTGELMFNSVMEPVASTGTGPVALAVDITGQYLYCVNSGSNDISIFKIGSTDGTLTPVGTTTVPTGGTTPAGIAITGKVN
jgi:6-phosphogluconolactonase (cycloisomerase 2 family)